MARKDSDICLQLSPEWGDVYKCTQGKPYCKNQNYAKDPKRCCPESCKNSEPFTETKCLQSETGGSCTYPFYTMPDECSECMERVTFILDSWFQICNNVIILTDTRNLLTLFSL